MLLRMATKEAMETHCSVDEGLGQEIWHLYCKAMEPYGIGHQRAQLTRILERNLPDARFGQRVAK